MIGLTFGSIVTLNIFCIHSDPPPEGGGITDLSGTLKDQVCAETRDSRHSRHPLTRRHHNAGENLKSWRAETPESMSGFQVSGVTEWGEILSTTRRTHSRRRHRHDAGVTPGRSSAPSVARCQPFRAQACRQPRQIADSTRPDHLPTGNPARIWINSLIPPGAGSAA